MSGMADLSGQALTASGRFYTPCAAAATTVVKGAAGRLCRVIVTAGTGSVTIYDNASTASGTILWALSAVAQGQPYVIDIPATNGIVCVTGAATTVNVVYN